VYTTALAFTALLHCQSSNSEPSKTAADAPEKGAGSGAGRALPMARDEKEEAVAQTQIERRVQDYAKAVSTKDIESVMSLYAPDIVSFDINPPLGYQGTDDKRRAWQNVFTAYAGPLAYEIHDLNVTAQGELAFVHSFNHVHGTLASGHLSDMWVRWTACFRRMDGVWRVVHDHVSVPADLEHGRAAVDLTPPAS
jgi:ketosteroid isomerase-like protein